MDEHREEREPVVERDRTTIIETGAGRDGGGGGGGLIAAVLLILVMAVVAFLVLGRGLGGDRTDIKVNVQARDIQMPDVDLPEVAPAGGNKSK